MQEGAGVRQVVEDELRRLGVRLRDLEVKLELGLQESARSAVAAGYGVTFISRAAVENELAAGHARRGEGGGVRCPPRDLARPWHRARPDARCRRVRRVCQRAPRRREDRRSASARARSSSSARSARPSGSSGPSSSRPREGREARQGLPLVGRLRRGQAACSRSRRCGRSRPWPSRSLPMGSSRSAAGARSTPPRRRSPSSRRGGPTATVERVADPDDVRRSRVDAVLRDAARAGPEGWRRQRAVRARGGDLRPRADARAAARGHGWDGDERARPLRGGVLPPRGDAVALRVTPTRAQRRSATRCRSSSPSPPGSTGAAVCSRARCVPQRRSAPRGSALLTRWPRRSAAGTASPRERRTPSASRLRSGSTARQCPRRSRGSGRRSGPRMPPIRCAELAALGGFGRLRDLGVPQDDLGASCRCDRGARRSQGESATATAPQIEALFAEVW